MTFENERNCSQRNDSKHNEATLYEFILLL